MAKKKTASPEKSAARKKAKTRKTATGKRTPRKKAAYPTAKGAPRRKVPNPALPEILEVLRRDYADAHCELDHRNAFELLIATILSAQCTDVRVNLVTEDLFAKYRGPADYLAVPQEELEEDIRSTGFYRNKAKNIRQACRTLLEEHDGEVPRDMASLRGLGGVGRKTANVVLGNIWNEPDGVVVDTHVTRISRKLGLTDEESAEKIERDLNRIIDREDWTMFSHWLIWHGRRVCNARNPNCEDCNLYAYCPTRA